MRTTFHPRGTVAKKIEQNTITDRSVTSTVLVQVRSSTSPSVTSPNWYQVSHDDTSALPAVASLESERQATRIELDIPLTYAPFMTQSADKQALKQRFSAKDLGRTHNRVAAAPQPPLDPSAPPPDQEGSRCMGQAAQEGLQAFNSTRQARLLMETGLGAIASKMLHDTLLFTNAS